MNELLSLAKEVLGIAQTSTAKDSSILMILNAAISDITRAGIKVDTSNHLIRNAMMLYLKANFGISSPDDKAKYMETYQLHLTNLSLSSEYRKEEV